MAYTTATTKQVDDKRAVVVFTGDAGEKDFPSEAPAGVDKNVWVFEKLAELNAKNTVVRTKPFVEGEVITPSPRPVPPLTLHQVYQRDRSIAIQDAEDVAAGIVAADDTVVVTNRTTAAASRAAFFDSKG